MDSINPHMPKSGMWATLDSSCKARAELLAFSKLYRWAMTMAHSPIEPPRPAKIGTKGHSRRHPEAVSDPRLGQQIFRLCR